MLVLFLLWLGVKRIYKYFFVDSYDCDKIAFFPNAFLVLVDFFQEVKPTSVMAAYHEIDGIPCHGSKELLTDILRELRGFDGLILLNSFCYKYIISISSYYKKQVRSCNRKSFNK